MSSKQSGSGPIPLMGTNLKSPVRRIRWRVYEIRLQWFNSTTGVQFSMVRWSADDYSS